MVRAPAAARLIPGLGTSVRPELLDESYVDEVVHVPEVDAVRMCRALAGNGFLFGGSTGSVVSGAVRWLWISDNFQVRPDAANVRRAVRGLE